MQSDWWLLLGDVDWSLHHRGMSSRFLPCIVRTATLLRLEKMVSARLRLERARMPIPHSGRIKFLEVAKFRRRIASLMSIIWFYRPNAPTP